MPLVTIHSLDDPRLDPYRELQRRQFEAREGLFVAEGRWLVQRLLASPLATLSVAVERRRLADVEGLAGDEVPVFVLPDGGAPQLVGFNFHRGVLACGRRPPPRRLTEWLERDQAAGSGVGVLVVLVGVQDPENVGGVIRNAAAFGARGVLLGPGCCDPYERRVLRVSMGTVFRLPILAGDDAAADLEELRRTSWRTVASVLDASATPLWGYMAAPRTAVLLGGEAFGLPADVTAACDDRVTIPMASGVDSLNVAAASAVLLYRLRLLTSPSAPK